MGKTIDKKKIKPKYHDLLKYKNGIDEILSIKNCLSIFTN